MHRFTQLRLLAAVAAFLCIGEASTTEATRRPKTADTWMQPLAATAIATSVNSQSPLASTAHPSVPAPGTSNSAGREHRRRRRSPQEVNPDPYSTNIRAFQMLGHFQRNVNRLKPRKQPTRPSSEGGSSYEGSIRSPSPPRPMEFRMVTAPRARSRHLTNADVLRPLTLSGGGGGGGGGGLIEMQPQALRAADESDDKRGMFSGPAWTEVAATARPEATPRRLRVVHFQPELLMMAPPGGPGVSSSERERLKGFAFTSTHWGPLGRKRGSDDSSGAALFQEFDDEGEGEGEGGRGRWKRSSGNLAQRRFV